MYLWWKHLTIFFKRTFNILFKMLRLYNLVVFFSLKSCTSIDMTFWSLKPIDTGLSSDNTVVHNRLNFIFQNCFYMFLVFYYEFKKNECNNFANIDLTYWTLEMCFYVCYQLYYGPVNSPRVTNFPILLICLQFLIFLQTENSDKNNLILLKKNMVMAEYIPSFIDKTVSDWRFLRIEKISCTDMKVLFTTHWKWPPPNLHICFCKKN